jgi:tape measure domain-containing protein
MADEHFGIIVEVDPSRAVPAIGRVEGKLADVAASGRRAGKAVGDSLTAAAREAAQAAEKSAHTQITAQQKIAKAAQQSAKEQSQRLTAAYREIVGPAAEFNRKLSEANALMRQGNISAQQYGAHIRKLQGEMRAFHAQGAAGGGARGGGGAGLSALGGLGVPLGAAAGVAVGVGLAKGALELSDSYANLTSRLITLTGSEAAAIPLRQKLLDLAQRTKTENSSVVELYARIAGSVKELGISESATIDFTERLTKSFKISGASTIAQQQAMIQLAQGLGAGALRGEEFNSVLEAAPNIIDIVGKHIGKTRGEMRAMAEDGALTTKTIIDAFSEAGGDIDEKFGKRIVTVGEQVVGFKNKLEVTVGELARSVNVSGAAQAAFDVLGDGVGELGEVLGILGTILNAQVEFWKAANDATDGWLAKIAKTKGAIGTFSDISDTAFGPRLGIVVNTQYLKAYNQTLAEGTALIEKRTAALWDGLDTQIAGNKASLGFGEGFAGTFRDRILESQLKYQLWKTKQASKPPGGGPAKQRPQIDIDEMSQSLDDLWASLTDINGAVVGETFAAWGEAAANAEPPFAALRERLAGIGDTIGDLGGGFADTMTDTFTAWGEAAAKAEEDAISLGDVLSEQLGAGLNDGIDLFVDSLNGASVSFTEFATSILADLEKMLIKLLLFKAIEATLGVGGGGLGATLAGALGFAAGGGFTVPNGGGGTDSVPVFFRATPGERVSVQTPGQQMSGGGGAAPVVNVKNVIVDDRHAAAREFLGSADGERAILNVMARNSGKVRAALS